MLLETQKEIGAIEGMVIEAIGQLTGLAHQEIMAGSPDMACVGRCLRLGSLLSSGLEDFQREDVKAGKPSPEHPEPAVAPEPEDDPLLAEITGRLRGSWLVRRGALVNNSPNSGWSYNIPKAPFVAIVGAYKSFASQGQCTYDELVAKSNAPKEIHVYRVYVLLYRAGLIRQRKGDIYFINEEEAKRLDPEAIWRYIPKE